MSDDFLKELGFLGVTARIKRLSDIFSKQIKELYIENNIDIEPSWHLIFLILKDKKQSSMSEIATSFQMSQAAVTKLLGRMYQKGYIIIEQDRNDRRKKNILLSKKGKNNLPMFESIWDAGQKSIQEILISNMKFLDSLNKIEKEMSKKNFKLRAMDHLSKKLEEKKDE